jgi:hypothetical protein
VPQRLKISKLQGGAKVSVNGVVAITNCVHIIASYSRCKILKGQINFPEPTTHKQLEAKSHKQRINQFLHKDWVVA